MKKNSTVPGVTLKYLPPYGSMWEDWQDHATKRMPPYAWGLRRTRAEYDRWFEDTRAIVRDNIWPEYDLKRGWIGNSAGNALAMTRADLDLILEFRRRNYFSRATPGPINGDTHYDFLEVEDMESWHKTLLLYCPELKPLGEGLEKIVLDGIQDRAGRVSVQLKWLFQRPRAYQVAMILGVHTPFPWGYARSSISPAMISGHCFQGCMMGCLVYSKLRGHDEGLARKCKNRIQLWATSIGDRRVMAGVHYPTDSIASWIVALRLVDYVIDDPAAKRFLKDAIRQRSLLYRFLSRKIQGSSAVRRPLRAPWTQLTKALV